MSKTYNVIISVSKQLYFKETGTTNFSDFIKISIIFLTATYKKSIKVKRIGKNVSKLPIFSTVMIKAKLFTLIKA